MSPQPKQPDKPEAAQAPQDAPESPQDQPDIPAGDGSYGYYDNDGELVRWKEPFSCPEVATADGWLRDSTVRPDLVDSLTPEQAQQRLDDLGFSIGLDDEATGPRNLTEDPEEADDA